MWVADKCLEQQVALDGKTVHPAAQSCQGSAAGAGRQGRGEGALMLKWDS